MVEKTFKTAPGGGKLYPFRGVWPELDEAVFIAPGARIIGNVRIGKGSSIWFNTVLRGDVNSIDVGARTNIQDGSIVHVDRGGLRAVIGDDVLIGHQAIVHGSIIEDGGFVGMGSIALDGSRIESGGMLAAGSLLSPGKIIGKSEMWVGTPARHVRDLSPEMSREMGKGARKYADLATIYNGS